MVKGLFMFQAGSHAAQSGSPVFTLNPHCHLLAEIETTPQHSATFFHLETVGNCCLELCDLQHCLTPPPPAGTHTAGGAERWS